jgi:hypothetical protein
MWTVLAAVVATHPSLADDKPKVLTLATGTKSIGRRQMNKDGYVLNDCHAEILA